MHFAATVKFDEKIKLATNINVRAVRDSLRLARGMRKLRVSVQNPKLYLHSLSRFIVNGAEGTFHMKLRA